jgi:hypothetical protein
MGWLIVNSPASGIDDNGSNGISGFATDPLAFLPGILSILGLDATLLFFEVRNRTADFKTAGKFTFN